MVFMRGKWSRSVGIIVMVSVAALIAGEWTAAQLGWPLPSGALFDHDSLLGYRYPKVACIDFEIAGLKYRVDFDEKGIADKRQGQNGVTYILGDGLVAGLELPPAERLAFRLSKLSGHTVLNLAVTGYGAIQQERMLRRYLQQGEVPEQVVLILNMDNDLIDNVREWDGGSVPSISIGDAQRLVQEPPPHGSLFSVARNALMASRLYGKLRAVLAATANNRQPDARTLELLSNWRDGNAQAAMLILRDTVAHMATLAEEYQIGFQVVVWIDPAIRARVPVEALDYFIEALYAALPQRTVLVFECDVCKEGAPYYVPGVRHFDSAATNELASFISQTK